MNAQRQRGWHLRNIDTVASELLPQRLPTFQHECLVPCGGDEVHPGWEHGVVISVAYTNGCILETDPIEVEARHATRVADAAVLGKQNEYEMSQINGH